MKRIATILSILLVLLVVGCGSTNNGMENTTEVSESSTLASLSSNDYNPEDFVITDDQGDSEYLDAIPILKNRVDYKTVFDASTIACNYEAKSLDELLSSDETAVRFVENSTIYVKYAWVGTKLYQPLMVQFKNGVCNKIGCFFDSSKTETIFSDLKTEFPNSKDAVKGSVENTVEIDLGDNYYAILETEGDGNWSINITYDEDYLMPLGDKIEPEDLENEFGTEATTEATTEPITEATTEATSEATTAKKKKNKKKKTKKNRDYYKTDHDYDWYMRNGEGGEKFSYTMTVNQTVEDGVYLCDLGSGYSGKMAFVYVDTSDYTKEITGGKKIIEDDTIRVYGEFVSTYTYTTAIGGSKESIVVKAVYVDIQ